MESVLTAVTDLLPVRALFFTFFAGICSAQLARQQPILQGTARLEGGVPARARPAGREGVPGSDCHAAAVVRGFSHPWSAFSFGDLRSLDSRDWVARQSEISCVEHNLTFCLLSSVRWRHAAVRPAWSVSQSSDARVAPCIENKP